jgi:subtilase family serine protease
MYGIHREMRRSARSGLIAFLLAGTSAVLAASAGMGVTPDTQLVPLKGNVHRLAHAQFDVGEAPDSLRMTGLDIVFAKTPEQERELQQLLSDQQNRTSPLYHHWLTPAQYGRRFGVTDATFAAVAAWLRSSGLAVGTLPSGRGHLPFFGNKAQIEGALHTRIHLFDVPGERHYANVSDPMIPAAFQAAVSAIRGLNDFHPKPGVRPQTMPGPLLRASDSRARLTPEPSTFYSGSGQYPGYVGPTDFAVMYNLQPEYQLGVTGVGVTVAITAQSDLDASVLAAFWRGFGVAGPSFGLPAQQFQSMPVPAADGGVDPGQTQDSNEDEAFLDTEIVGALAPGAQLLLVRDQSASTAAQYVIDQNLAAVLNISFSQCEADLGSDNAAINAMFEQAAGEGMTVIVSAGDTGAAGCTATPDFGKQGDVNTNGFAVNGIASTPYDLAVGGTDFNPSVEAQYWMGSNQPGTLASAQSHIPEMAWNQSCANSVLAQIYLDADPITFCNTAKLQNASGAEVDNPFIEIAGGGGGVSSCIATNGNGACTVGYPQPSWQAGFDIGNYGARAVPDVSMIATRWLMCSYDTDPCDPTQPPTFPPAATGTIRVVVGTSAAAPSVAAIIAMLDQTQITTALPDGRQGLVNPLFYQLASSEFQNPIVEGSCNAAQGPIEQQQYCTFYDVTVGSNAQPCSVANYTANASDSVPASACVGDTSDATGLMEMNGSQDYGTFIGFDLATGIGSINASALITAVQSSTAAPSGLAWAASGQTVSLYWTADVNATEGYDIYQGTVPGTVSPTPVQQNVMGTGTNITGLQFGQTYVFAIAAVSSSGVSPRSIPIDVTIVPAAPTGVSAQSSGAGSLVVSWARDAGANDYEVFEGTATEAEGNVPVLTGITGTTVTINGFTPGQQPVFSIYALNAGGTSAPSAQAGGTVAPAAPTAVAATAGNGSVSLSWSAVAGASTYEVFEGTTSRQEGAQAIEIGISGTTASIGGLSNGTKYYFTVAAVNAGGASAPSAEASATPAAPAAPASRGGGGSLDWRSLVMLVMLATLVSSRRMPSLRLRRRP